MFKVLRLLIGVLLVAAFTPALSAETPIQARVCVSRQEMRDLCGGAFSKLVFVNGQTLYYVDFSQDPPAIVPIANVRGCIAPVISPAGEHITYAIASGNLEINASASSAWVCTLSAQGVGVKAAEPGFLPRFVKNVSGRAIIYSTCGKKMQGKDYVWDGCGRTVTRTAENGSIGPEQTLYSGGSYNGGISCDNRYLSTSESSPGAFILDLKNPNGIPDTIHKFIVKNTSTGKDTAISCQVCNLSSSPSTLYPRAQMYLDFSSNVFTYAHCEPPLGLATWGIHTRIFISSATNSILRYYDIPQIGFVTPSSEVKGIGELTERQWDFPEWSNHPYLAVSSVLCVRSWLSTTWEETDRHEQIYCINLKDSTYHKIIETTDSSQTSLTNMQWPWLWIDVPTDFHEDSTWLGAPSAIKRSAPENRANSGISFDGNVVKSGKSISQISIYSLLGEKLMSEFPKNAHEYRVAHKLRTKGKAIVYFVKVKTIDGACAVFRYNTLNIPK